MGEIRDPGGNTAAAKGRAPWSAGGSPAGAVAGVRSAPPARLARLALGAAFLALACLAPGPQAGAQTAPTASDSGVLANEDIPYAFRARDFNFSDTDSGDTLAKVKIVTLPGAGSLTNDGTPVTANQEIARADIDDDKLVFTPAANGNGSDYASFTFKVNDGDAESALSYTMAIAVIPLNDAPTASDSRVLANEDIPYAFRARDFRFSDVDANDPGGPLPGATLARVKIVTLPGAGSLTIDGAPVRANQEIAKADIDDDKLVFTPAPNANGPTYASFTFKVNDRIADSVDSYTMTIAVFPLNDAPTASDNTVATDEDTAYTFEADDFRFSDVDANDPGAPLPGDSLARVKIVTLPGAGSLTFNGNPVRANQEIAKADIDDEKLVFTPAANANGAGYASFTFKVNDRIVDSVDSYTMTVDVTAVNDAPTAFGRGVVIDEDTAYTFEAGDFNFRDVDVGDALAKVRIVTLPGAGSLTNDGTPVRANDEVTKAEIDDDKLVFTPAANANGAAYARFSFKVNDGDAESVDSYRIVLGVNAVNDAPTASNDTVTTDEDTAYTFEAGDFNFSDVDSGDTLAKVKIVTLPGAGSLTNDGTPVTANQEIAKTDIDDDKLVFARPPTPTAPPMPTSPSG